jgi:hypothetical protein
MLRFELAAMQFKRTAKFVIVGAAVAAWLAAAVTSGRRPAAPPSVSSKRAIDARGAALAGETSKLHERLRPTATPREPGRNLFTFARSVSRKTETTRSASTSVDRVSPAPQPAPPLKLFGIGEDVTPDAVVRTAVISSVGQVFLAKEGDDVTDRYRVLRISSDVVELTDRASGTTIRLALQ